MVTRRKDRQERAQEARRATNTPSPAPEDPHATSSPQNPHNAPLDPTTRARNAALTLWGCPRPDKTHHLTHHNAQQALNRHTHKPDHDPTANVYQCPCGAWVWGRRKPGNKPILAGTSSM